MTRRSYTLKHPQEEHAGGIGWLLAACFLVGDMAGAGLMALPVAMIQGGVVFGSIASLVCATAAAFSSALLGDSLVIMRRRWPELRQQHTGTPFTDLARHSFGAVGERILNVMLYITSTGTLVVVLLLTANNVEMFINGNFGVHINKCAVLVLLGLALWPLVMFRSLKDVGWIGLVASLATAIAVVVIVTASVHDGTVCAPMADHSSTSSSLASMSLAFGTIMFSYGGQAAFPTIQMEMKRPSDFARSVYLSYAVLYFLLYSPVALLGYYVYGNSMGDTIINSIQVNWMQQSVTFLISVHTIAAYVIYFSPLAHGAESWLGAKARQPFSTRNLLVRSCLLWFTVFSALTVPRFGVFLDLIGGSFITALCLVWPGLFYLALSSGERKRETLIRAGQASKADPDNTTVTVVDMFMYNDAWKTAAIVGVMVLGVVGGCIATTTAFDKLLGAEMEAPCYIKYFTHGVSFTRMGGSVNCCGRWRNVSIWDDPSLCSPFSI